MNTPKRRAALFAAGLMTIALTATACGSGGGGSSSEEDAGKPVKGGTLNMLGIGDVDYMDPNVIYYSVGYLLPRLWSRQLFTFPAEEGKTTTAVPDLADRDPDHRQRRHQRRRQDLHDQDPPRRQVEHLAGPPGDRRGLRPRREAHLQPGPAVRRVPDYATLIEGYREVLRRTSPRWARGDARRLTKYIDSNAAAGRRRQGRQHHRRSS